MQRLAGANPTKLNHAIETCRSLDSYINHYWHSVRLEGLAAPFSTKLPAANTG